ncbi:MAG: ribosome biogenesis/translation initiation ATPase RLI [Thermoplasmatota archaeon]
MRIAVVESDRCQPKKCQYECVTFCPVVRQGIKECIQPGPVQGKAVISEELCVGCGICVNKCPFDAIHIVNLPQALDEDLVHRYGENQFALFRLPIPRAGAVVGLLGPNGIGKTTAIKILSGNVIPNLGEVPLFAVSPAGGLPASGAAGSNIAKPSGAIRVAAAPKAAATSKPGASPTATGGGTDAGDVPAATWDTILKKYAGTELGDYLARVAKGEIKAVVKPQYVDKLPKAVRGILRDLILNADERHVALDYATRLGLDSVLDRPIDKLSGGELQRAAIVAALARNADVYFVDEPSSYLDIDQRLRVARLLREVAESGKSLVVIEHDLAVLDFLADEAHLVYGQEGAYGVVALRRGVRQAINTYLEGYMREENIRFRDTRVEFELHPPRHQWKGAALVEFPDLKKVQGDFTLETKAGSIKAGEVVGIVGPNATGKTTFVKMIAGVEKPTEGVLTSNTRVAYKPQYLSTDFDGSVETLFYATLGAKPTETFFQNEIARPLGLKRLETKLVKDLSGGELQRVAIALCLGQDAELYLIDEPSAYLDVDQRMLAAKTIRRVMENRARSALVVDHDIYFLDVIADSLMVFGGTPGQRGSAVGPLDLREGMNTFLKGVDITFRRDKETLRPRVNKPGSRLDRDQRAIGEYYYEPAATDAE